MWVEQRGPATWRGGYRTVDGVKVQRSFGTEREAQRWAEVAEAAEFGVVDKAANPTPATTVGEYAQQWLARRNGLQPRSLGKYRTQAAFVAESPLSGISLESLTANDVERHFAALDADSTITVAQRNTRLKYLRMILKRAVGDGALILTPARPDPTLGVVVMKPDVDDDDLAFDDDDLDDDLDDEQGRWLAPEVIEGLLTAAADPHWANRWRMMFAEGELHLGILLGAEAGLRWGEIGALGRTSTRIVDGVTEIRVRRSVSTKGRMGPTKSGKARWVPVSTRLAEAIARQQRIAKLQQRPLLVARPDGSPWRYDWSVSHLRAAAEQAGVGPLGGWHDLRHTYGSTLADRGVPVQRIADLMGHSHTDVTRLYVHRAPAASLRASVAAVFG